MPTLPAATLAQLFAFEDQFSNAAVAVLVAAGYASPLDRGSSAPKSDTSIVVKFTRGPATGAVTQIPRGPMKGRSEFTQFTGSLQIAGTRPRKANTTVATDGFSRELGKDMGVISSLFLRDALPFAAVPYLDVSEILPQAASFGVNDTHELDVFELNWLVTFSIKAAAWPA